MRIHGNDLFEVAELQASRVLAADDEDDEEDEEEQRWHDDEEEDDEDEEEETVWTSSQHQCHTGNERE